MGRGPTIDKVTKSRILDMLGDLDATPDYRRVSKRSGIPESTLRTIATRERKRLRDGGVPRERSIPAESEVDADDVADDVAGRGSGVVAAFEIVAHRRKPGDPRVSLAQVAAIEATVAGKSNNEIAAAAGVALRTIFTWRQDPGYMAALAEALARVQAAYSARVVGLREAAADRLAVLLPDASASVALDALTATMDRTGFPKTERIDARVQNEIVDARLAAMSDAELRAIAEQEE